MWQGSIKGMQILGAQLIPVLSHLISEVDNGVFCLSLYIIRPHTVSITFMSRLCGGHIMSWKGCLCNQVIMSLAVWDGALSYWKIIAGLGCWNMVSAGAARCRYTCFCFTVPRTSTRWPRCPKPMLEYDPVSGLPLDKLQVRWGIAMTLWTPDNSSAITFVQCDTKFVR